MNLWLRIGDNSDYENFGDDFDVLIESLKEYKLGKFLGWERLDNGFMTDNFSGQNYISIFWGDEIGNFVKRLSKSERDFIKNALST